MNALIVNHLVPLALVAQAEAESAVSPWPSVWMMVVIIAIFYFIVVSPQRKEAKDRDTMRAGLAKGDEVVTIGGLHGQVASVEKETVTLRVGGKVDMTFDRGAIARLVKKAES